jgi:hypothetical protein
MDLAIANDRKKRGDPTQWVVARNAILSQSSEQAPQPHIDPKEIATLRSRLGSRL